ncbi:putative prefoldin subunit 5 [Intoshia linei]|uniref:Putative prefoldin subunit 5 n=1 Tax=Intoshia linei TaxID=1819745 RepID=A0A177B0I5_9BILA|nr:putative prefoldin subunit 5 [Intoshia linei]
MATEKAKPLKISTLDIQTVYQLTNQTQREIEFFNQSIIALRSAADKLANSKNLLKDIHISLTRKTSYLPIDESVYCKGKISNYELVSIDIGAGFFVEMPIKQAEDYFQRKFNFIQKEIKIVTNRLPDKEALYRGCVNELKKRESNPTKTQAEESDEE